MAIRNVSPNVRSIMPPRNSRITRVIREAEGYLELGLPEQAAHTLDRRGSLIDQSGRANYLWGESLRMSEQYKAAIRPLERAIQMMPEDMHVSLALAWCYKRTNRLQQAIETLEDALEFEPTEAILHYNLACYWSLAGRRRRALRCLSRALDLDGNYIELVPYESDFDAMREDPEFQLLTSLIV